MSISGWMVRNIQDSLLRFTEPGLPVYLRIKNSVETDKEYLEYGFQISVTGLADAPGYRDIAIDPPASIAAVSMHNIGLNQTALRFGATTFKISHTFVMRMMVMKGYLNPREVFTNEENIGLVYNGGLFSIESITTEDVANEIIFWIITGNRSELQADS